MDYGKQNIKLQHYIKNEENKARISQLAIQI